MAAASLQIRADTVGDDSLADLDELAFGDLVAILAKIVTGETQIEARSACSGPLPKPGRKRKRSKGGSLPTFRISPPKRDYRFTPPVSLI